jgi:hypothetical protein
LNGQRPLILALFQGGGGGCAAATAHGRAF